MQPVLAHDIRGGDILVVHLTDGAGFYRYDEAANALHSGSSDTPAIPLGDLAVAGRVTAFLREVGQGPGPDATGDSVPGRRWRRSSRRVADAREGRGRRGPQHR